MTQDVEIETEIEDESADGAQEAEVDGEVGAGIEAGVDGTPPKKRTRRNQGRPQPEEAGSCDVRRRRRARECGR